MPRIVVYPYKIKSNSAVKLKEYLAEEGAEALLVYPDRAYRPHPDDLIIGWGSGDWPSWKRRAEEAECTWLNPSDTINNAINKIETFNLFRAAHIPCPEWTTRSYIAMRWVREGHTVLARQELGGRDGAGLVVITNEREFVPAELYTKYENKISEFRVHVFNGEAFWAQERVPIEEEDNRFYRENPNQQIRTSSNGWTLYVANRHCPSVCKAAAIAAVTALGLDFGAVDIGWKKRTTTGVLADTCVYEVNTAPELTNRTCSAYVQQILSIRG